MPPKKGKAVAKAKGKAKEPQAEPVANGAAETTQDVVETAAEDVPKSDQPENEESKAEESKAEESKVEETKAEEEPVIEEPAAVEGSPEEPMDEEETAAPIPKPETKPEKKASKKRKAEAPAPREGSRKSGRNASKATASTEQLLNYLLSPAAAELCRPDDEADEIEAHGADYKTYTSTPMTPFEELICAVILSRPINHKLGMRTIRTLLNAPYNFNTPKAITSAGKETRQQALNDAKTQHKDKTAEQIGLVADVVAHKFGKNDTDTSLDKLRDQAHKGWDLERDLLQENIKGVGKTGLDIFFRRVQWLWPEAFPFVDEKSARGIDKLGLPKNPDELAKVLDRYWAKLDTSGVEVGGKSGDREMKKRRAFVIICERATGADLDGKTDAILEAAADL